MSNLPQKNGLWQFTDDQGSFRVLSPELTSRLYFPLANEAGMLSAVTPDLHGDTKTGLNHFLTLPVTTENLHDSKATRNFWVYVEGRGAWSATGASAWQNAQKFKKKEKVTLDAGMLWHKITRENAEWGLQSEVTSFVPASASDAVELMIVTLTNTGKSPVRLTPTSATPLFARSADNVRDHHHVTSLLNRLVPHHAGVVIRPSMSFDERGHEINEMLYAVLGATGAGELPVGSFPSVPEFVGEGGDFETPRAIMENRPAHPKETSFYHGSHAMGALRFKSFSLRPGDKTSFVLILAIAKKESELEDWHKKYGSLVKAEAALKETKEFWTAKADAIHFETQDRNYNGWMRWVGLQPTFRKIFGCSFLPDFDYGRGGRGWRDLWQDCLALLLTSPGEAREMLVNNFGGVRIDGSNATIIGSKTGEFIADRNNITRVWMDHGVWPYLTLELYIHQSGDFDILFQNTRYFRDRQQSRARQKDARWTEADSRNLKNKSGDAVEGSILEHVLVQHLVQFFNVGEHNHIRLENADWNDGLDMAYTRGESVAFSALYGSNLKKIAILLEKACQKMSLKKIPLAKELLLLLDRADSDKINYASVEAKVKRLQLYFDAVQPVVSGKKIEVSVAKLIDDLNQKSDFIFEHIRQKEWIETRASECLYNGYYDNHGRRVEGDSGGLMHMTLAGQVFPIMSGVATAKQIGEIFKTAKTHLKDKEHGGFRLNTDFKAIRPDLGRAFSFAYGEKENGAFFSHMAIMFANALYQRGAVNEGYEVLDSIYRMSLRTDKSKIYPCVPEYFNSEGRGLYLYLTGSASWLVLTVLTQVFGVRGQYGDLLLAPKLVKAQFPKTPEASVETWFAGRRLKIIYQNPKRVSYEHYCVTKVSMNGKELKGLELNKKEVLIPLELLLKSTRKSDNSLVVTLE